MGSFTLLDDDNDAAQLDAAFALIDECTDCIALPPASTPDSTALAQCSSVEPASAVSAAVFTTQSPPLQPRQSGKRNRKRENKQLEQLRRQVTLLQEQYALLQHFSTRTAPRRVIAQLQSSVCDSETAAAATQRQKIWFEHAMAEYKQLEQANALNKQLRTELDAHRHANAQLERLFALQLAPAEDLNVATTTTALITSNRPTSSTSALTDLLAYTKDLYARTPEVAAMLSRRDARCAFRTSHTEQDPVFGHAFEFTASTLLPHSVRDLSDFMWRQVTLNASAKCAQSNQHYVSDQQTNCFTKQVSMAFNNALGGYNMDSVVAIERFVTSAENRVVLVFASRQVVPNSQLVLRHDGHVIVTAHSGGGTLLQSYFRVYRERPAAQDDGIAQPLPQDLALLQEFVVSFTGRSIAEYQVRLHDELQHEHQGSIAISEQHQRDLSIGCLTCRMRKSIQRLTVS